MAQLAPALIFCNKNSFIKKSGSNYSMNSLVFFFHSYIVVKVGLTKLNGIIKKNLCDTDYGFDESMYVVSTLRDLPKLHRAVWRGDLLKVKSICNGIRKTVLNTRDKEYRLAFLNY